MYRKHKTDERYYFIDNAASQIFEWNITEVPAVDDCYAASMKMTNIIYKECTPQQIQFVTDSTIPCDAEIEKTINLFLNRT